VPKSQRFTRVVKMRIIIFFFLLITVMSENCAITFQNGKDTISYDLTALAQKLITGTDSNKDFITLDLCGLISNPGFCDTNTAFCVFPPGGTPFSIGNYGSISLVPDKAHPMAGISMVANMGSFTTTVTFMCDPKANQPPDFFLTKQSNGSFITTMKSSLACPSILSCPSISDCGHCLGSNGCSWCLSSYNCIFMNDTSCSSRINNPKFCPNNTAYCASLTQWCQYCTAPSTKNRCKYCWSNDTCVPSDQQGGGCGMVAYNPVECSAQCCLQTGLSTCSTCTSGNGICSAQAGASCGWCLDNSRCIISGSNASNSCGNYVTNPSFCPSMNRLVS